MAYKFQRGGFTASGSITAEEGLSSQTTLSASSTLQVGGTATLAGVNATSVTVTGPVSGSGNFQVGGTLTAAAPAALNGGLTSTTISGSGNMQAGGTLTVAGQGTFNNGLQVTAGSTTLQALTASALSGSAFDGLTSNIIARWNDTAGIFDASYLTHDAGNTRTIFANTLSGSGNVQVGGTLAVAGTSTLAGVNAQATTATTLSASSTLQVGGTSTLQAVNAQALTATTISGSSTLQVGSSATVANGLTVTAGGLTVSAGDSSVQKLTVNGDLIVLGTTFSASVGSLLIEDAAIVIGDGSTAFGSGYGLLFGSGSNQWASLQTAVDGATNVLSSSLPIKASSFIGSIVTAVSGTGDTNATLVTGINYATTTFGATRTWTLPSAPSVGDSVKIKGPSNLSPSVQLIVSRAGSHTIDGETTVALESPYAAIECVYVTTNTWVIF